MHQRNIFLCSRLSKGQCGRRQEKSSSALVSIKNHWTSLKRWVESGYWRTNDVWVWLNGCNEGVGDWWDVMKACLHCILQLFLSIIKINGTFTIILLNYFCLFRQPHFQYWTKTQIITRKKRYLSDIPSSMLMLVFNILTFLTFFLN